MHMFATCLFEMLICPNGTGKTLEIEDKNVGGDLLPESSQKYDFWWKKRITCYQIIQYEEKMIFFSSILIRCGIKQIGQVERWNLYDTFYYLDFIFCWNKFSCQLSGCNLIFHKSPCKLDQLSETGQFKTCMSLKYLAWRTWLIFLLTMPFHFLWQENIDDEDDDWWMAAERTASQTEQTYFNHKS